MYIDHIFYIGFRDIDFQNKLKIKSMFSYLEDIAGMHSNLAGYGVYDIPRIRKSWVLINWKLEFIQKPSYADTIKIKTWSRNMDKHFAYRDFLVYDIKGEVIAKASSKWILINVADLSICKLNDEMKDEYEIEQDQVFEEDFSKFKDTGNYINSCDVQITKDMIDINGHVHNLDYLDFASRVVPQEVMENATKVEVLYKKEIKETDSVKCFYSKEGDTHYAVLKSSDEKILHAIISFQK